MLLVGGVSSVWADTEWQLAWADYFEDASNYTTNTSWSSTNSITVSQHSRTDGVSSKSYHAIDASANGRTLTYTIGNAYTAGGTSWSKYTFDADEAYKLEFDAAFRSSRGNSGGTYNSTFTIPGLTVGTFGTGSATATFTAINDYSTTIKAGDNLFTINVYKDNASTSDANVSGYFYHYVIEARSTGTTLTVYGPYSSGTYSETPVYNGTLSASKVDVSQLICYLTRYYVSVDLDNVELYKEVEAGYIETPTAAITAVDGKNRTVSFSCATDGVTLSYSTDGGSTFTNGTSLVISENTNIIVKATKGTSSATSESQLFEAGTNVTLNTPSASVTALTLNENGLYYPTVSASYNPSGVLLSPNATLSAKFNGSTVSLPYAATTEGTLVITASYDGYESSEYNYNVVGYAKVLWKDYTTYSTSSRPDGIRKWSGDDHWEIAEGYGFKSIRTDGKAWCQIDRAGMAAYDVLSEASPSAVESTVILPNNHNTGTEDLQYLENGKVLSKLYYFTEGKSVTITSAGWATLYTDKALDFSDVSGLTAYTATCAENTVTLTTVTNVPANTGVVLKGAANTYSIPVIESSETPKGDLTGSTTTATAYNGVSGKDLYVLVINSGKAQFTKVGSGEIAAGKAYLPLTASLARTLSVEFDGDATGINNVTAEMKAEDAIFNLAGQRVAQPANGLYIVNGKKVIVK